jgi:hypothetical protein
MQSAFEGQSRARRRNRHRVVLALLPVLLLLAAPSPVSASGKLVAGSQPSTAQQDAWSKAGSDGRSLIATARALEPFVVRQTDGTFHLVAPREVTRSLPARQVATLLAGVEVLNARIASGSLQTTVGGGVFDPLDDRLLVRDGWTGHGYAWWGQYWCFSHEALASLAAYPNGILAASTIAVITAIPGIGGVIDVFIALYLGWLVYDDYGNGSCLNESWALPPGWVTSQ